jgi:hypothetical protein
MMPDSGVDEYVIIPPRISGKPFYKICILSFLLQFLKNRKTPS